MKYRICVDNTHVSPNKLDTIIKKNGQWTSAQHDFQFHNCQTFVRWCIDQIKNFPDICYALDFD